MITISTVCLFVALVLFMIAMNDLWSLVAAYTAILNSKRVEGFTERAQRITILLCVAFTVPVLMLHAQSSMQTLLAMRRKMITISTLCLFVALVLIMIAMDGLWSFVAAYTAVLYPPKRVEDFTERAQRITILLCVAFTAPVLMLHAQTSMRTLSMAPTHNIPQRST